MRGRLPVGYVVKIEGSDVTLNLLDMHRGQLASHAQGVSSVTEVGSLLVLDAGSRALVMKVVSLSFDEPREAHRLGIGSSTHQTEPLRNISGAVVGRLSREQGTARFTSDSLATPPLGAEAFPLSTEELAAILCGDDQDDVPLKLGDDLRGGGSLNVGLKNLISRHVAVLGSSGQGKSCFSAAVLQQIVKLPGARVVVFDINGEYETALDLPELPNGAVKCTTIGGPGTDTFKIPYYALGRHGLNRLLIPSEKTQRPALTFALEHLHQVRWFPQLKGAGLASDTAPFLFDDCRQGGAADADRRIQQIRNGQAGTATVWPHMAALAALVAESHGIQPSSRNGPERNAFSYSNVSPLITRINRLAEDPMFRAVVDVEGGAGTGTTLNWAQESTNLVEQIFGGQDVPWRVHIINLRHLSHDLTPFILGSLLELYAYELFRRGQENKIPTLLVLEEAHHYLRPIGSGDDAGENSLAYERLAKEGRKFGLALWLSTQRPSEISPTVLSQCNNWISFRLTSEKDLAAIQSASEWADRREIRRIAGLPRQTAIVFGGSIAMPTLIRAADASPTPHSGDADFSGWATRRPDAPPPPPVAPPPPPPPLPWNAPALEDDVPF
ncbi:ATP-binding protein [Pseudomonas aeruginosa]|uniref:anti-phage-associated helicase HerA n=1 Tax=Pseudomonas aeruginosa TaxID=287 RepID=UPI0021F1290E|nr:anti-phage-associated helicase HerA [Pseudomonas aeruginosa]MCV6104756.1 ATP-binding protein [Pseudomonas aeruginosa]MDI2201424.1 ATP-binding protein [Pseudomonas aeruginosa]HBO3958486.1 ATP-binding protein [Pseudomonas aeruginosa]HCF6076478.1 ATP-binding protein [Pseudomonas aeruginosa]HEP8278278.1 ATP-binding protein [Pseudomonas aeruginosa]